MAELPSGTVTFLFTDIEGSTALTLSEEYPNALRKHRELLGEAVERAGGIVYGLLGDEVSAVFRTAAEAVEAAGFGQRSFVAEAWPGDVNVRVRVGIHTGRTAGEPGEYLGFDVHRTARICSAGHGGQVLISGVANDALGDSLPAGLSLRDLGKHHLKDLPEPEHLFQLLIAGVRNDFPALRVGPESPSAPQLPGRARELAGSLQKALRALHSRKQWTPESEKIAPREPTVGARALVSDAYDLRRLPRPRDK
jgi:class 3 adenylate cyclase